MGRVHAAAPHVRRTLRYQPCRFFFTLLFWYVLIQIAPALLTVAVFGIGIAGYYMIRRAIRRQLNEQTSALCPFGRLA